MVEHCDFTEQATVHHRRRRRCGRTWWSTSPAARTSWSTPRSRSAATSRRRGHVTRRPARPGSRPTPGTCATTSTRWPPRRTGSGSTPTPGVRRAASCPADAFLDAALEQDPALLEHAFERNVVIATPTTLVALLRTVGYAWRQEALADNAREVFELARELYTAAGGDGRPRRQARPALNSAVNALQHGGRRRWRAGCWSAPASCASSRSSTTSCRRRGRSSPPRARSEKEVLVTGDTLVAAVRAPRLDPSRGRPLGGREASGSPSNSPGAPRHPGQRVRAARGPAQPTRQERGVYVDQVRDQRRYAGADRPGAGRR